MKKVEDRSIRNNICKVKNRRDFRIVWCQRSQKKRVFQEGRSEESTD